MPIWRSIKDDRVHDIIVTPDNKPPKAGYERVPDNWGGAHGDKAEWFDSAGRRIPDKQLVETGLRTDNRGTWHSTENINETKQIHDLDAVPGEGWTREKPLENEPYQKWDVQHWVVDTEKKEEAEKSGRIGEIQNKIVEYEAKLQRPLIALADPGITPEDETRERLYYSEYTGKIKELRVQREKLLSA